MKTLPWALALLVVAGCSGSSDRTIREASPSVADQIKLVEANANMPEDQKAAIIAQLRQQEAAAGGRAQASGK